MRSYQGVKDAIFEFEVSSCVCRQVMDSGIYTGEVGKGRVKGKGWRVRPKYCITMVG